MALGDYDRAFAWLERAYQEQSNILQVLKVDPFFVPLQLKLNMIRGGSASVDTAFESHCHSVNGIICPEVV